MVPNRSKEIGTLANCKNFPSNESIKILGISLTRLIFGQELSVSIENAAL